jgi:hypothetical protein
MLVIILISVLAFAFYISSTSTYILIRNNMLSQQVYYLAQSGMDYALANDLTDTSLWPRGTSYTVPEGSISITLSSPSSDTYSIVSTAVSGLRSRQIAATVQAGKITIWE